MPLTPVLSCLLLSLVLPAAFFDLRSRRIPNWLCLAGLVAGLVIHLATPWGGGWRVVLYGFGAATLVYLPLYMLRAMGAGDVKLMMAAGALVGPITWVILFIATSLLGGIFGAILVLSRGRARRTLFNLMTITSELAHGRRPHKNHEYLDVKNDAALRLPHGAVIALGSLAVIGLRAAMV
jgi:prepilin peptidase CpaA